MGTTSPGHYVRAEGRDASRLGTENGPNRGDL